MSGIQAYIICTTPRSGSTLLCNLLRDCGQAGAPESYFHRPSRSDWCKGLNLPRTASLAQIFNAAILAGKGDTPLFGLRLQRDSAPFFFDQLRKLHPDASNDVKRLTACFGPLRFIHLTRQDKVAQAVSLVRAQQSGLWHRNADGSERERTAQAQTLRYDQKSIAAELDILTRQEAEWRRWFEINHVHPMRVSYDDLSAHPVNELARIMGFLGIKVTNEIAVSPATAKLADATNTAWTAQFLRDIETH